MGQDTPGAKPLTKGHKDLKTKTSTQDCCVLHRSALPRRGGVQDPPDYSASLPTGGALKESPTLRFYLQQEPTEGTYRFSAP